MRSPFRVNPASDLFQRKIDEILKELPNIFGIAYDILIVGYDEDGTEQYITLHRYSNYVEKKTSNLIKMNGISGTLAFHSLEKLFLGIKYNLTNKNV